MSIQAGQSHDFSVAAVIFGIFEHIYVSINHFPQVKDFAYSFPEYLFIFRICWTCSTFSNSIPVYLGSSQFLACLVLFRQKCFALSMTQKKNLLSLFFLFFFLIRIELNQVLKAVL